ncbi:Uncharacterised protein [Halioglobus japonicus]|nr:Uncharacterised protein [Halioglobus japonicus]
MPDHADSETGADTTGKDAVLTTLATLEASGAARFDPVQFRYIQSIAQRSLQQDGAVADLLAEKAHQALKTYESSWADQYAEMASLVEKTAAQQPALTEQLANLLEAGDFSAVKRLARRRQTPDKTDSFPGLTQLLQTNADDDGALPTDSQELKSVRYFRDALQRQHADRLVSHALMDAPEDAGPLNPQKLALQSLSIMREISPAYLGHFVSYLDTLFWLEKLDAMPPAK